MTKYIKFRYLNQLYVQVLVGIVVGGLIGYFWPQVGAGLQPIADGFIKLIKMLLSPIIFGTVVVGIAKMNNIKEVGRIGVKLQGLFRIVAMVMRLAPLGAGAGIAFTIGKYGIGTIWSLGYLMLGVYVTTIFFIVVILGSIAWWSGFPLTQFFRYFKDEIFIVLGTCSTEAVMPQMLAKLERLGCEKTVVGMVLPTGYTFNADGTSIYLSMAAVFVAQATNTDLSLADQLVLLAVLLLTSNGSAGVAGAGFVTLAATLSSIHTVPVAGLVLLLGVDRFMNEARAVTNLIGNGVATIAIAKWDEAFDQQQAKNVMQRHREGRATSADDVLQTNSAPAVTH
jgi:aerobic C4-dicarboxylate transport protein